MTHVWTAEHEVDQATAAELIAAQFPELAPVHVQPFGVGWDNVAFLINDAFVFRFPRRRISISLLQHETQLLRLLAPALPLAVPLPTFVGQPTTKLPALFVGYRCVPGTTACRARLDGAARTRAAAPLAGFLRALHSFPLHRARAAGLPDDDLARTDVELRKRQTLERLESLQRDAVLAAVDVPWPLLESADAPAPYTPCVVHGDLYARHVLVNDRYDVTGIIDWGDVHAGHPGLDLSIAYAFLPEGARAQFFRHYGDVDPATHAFARFRALFSAVALVHYGHAIADQALLDEGRRALVHLQQGLRRQ